LNGAGIERDEREMRAGRLTGLFEKKNFSEKL